MFVIADRLGEGARYRLGFAFRAWAPNAGKLRVRAALKKLAIIANTRLPRYFAAWVRQTSAERFARLREILTAHGQLLAMFEKWDKLSVKLFFDDWAGHNKL
jgi:hypothetical protein